MIILLISLFQPVAETRRQLHLTIPSAVSFQSWMQLYDWQSCEIRWARQSRPRQIYINFRNVVSIVLQGWLYTCHTHLTSIDGHNNYNGTPPIQPPKVFVVSIRPCAEHCPACGTNWWSRPYFRSQPLYLPPRHRVRAGDGGDRFGRAD